MQQVPDLDEALRFHGFTREKIQAEMIRWLDSVRLESPDLHRALVSDPPEISSSIDRWDFVMSTGMTCDYPIRRRWTEWMALREFVQNALDIEEETFGYDNIKIDVAFHPKLRAVKIADRGMGIPFEAFKMGGSDKKCYSRGYFGEGLKVAGAYYVANAKYPYIFNKQGQVFKFTRMPGTNLVAIVIGRHRQAVAGTAVIILNTALDIPISDMVFQEWMKKKSSEGIKVFKRSAAGLDCPTLKPNFIVYDPKKPIDVLWVRDIYVNSIMNIAGNPSLFGYNLWWVDLEPNRVNVASGTEFLSEVEKFISPDVVRILLDYLLVDRGTHAAIAERPIMEANLSWLWPPDETFEAVGKWVKEKGMAVLHNESMLNWTTYMGVKPLVVPMRMHRLFKEAPTVEDIMAKNSEELTKSATSNIMHEENLPFVTLLAYNIGKAIMQSTFINHFHDRMPDIFITKLQTNIGTPVAIECKQGIFIDYEKLHSTDFMLGAKDVDVMLPSEMKAVIGCMLHEFSHYYAERKGYESRDVSEGFEQALTEVLGTSNTMMATDTTLADAVGRIKTGAWKSLPYAYKKDHYSPNPSSYDSIINLLHENDIRWNESIEVLKRRTASVVVYNRVLGHFYFHDPLANLVPARLSPKKYAYYSILDKEVQYLEEGGSKEDQVIFVYEPWSDTYMPVEKFKELKARTTPGE